MGAGASRGILEDPFPVEPSLSKDLDRLSLVAARILSTPDIYDINNLARPGVCGDYAVFLKNSLEKKLLGYTFQDVSNNEPAGPAMEVVYQNPRRAISKPELRQRICTQIADTMLTVIATVVACLASIQVASPSRETAVAGIAQKGGAISADVIVAWLTQKGYVSPTAVPPAATGDSISLTLQDRVATPAPASTPVVFTLTLKRAAERTVLSGSLMATGGSPAMPPGSLRVDVGAPIPIPGTAPADSILPIRVADTAGSPWMVGALYGDAFVSLSTTPKRASPFEIWTSLFRLTQNLPPTAALEDRASVIAANEIFRQYRERADANYILGALRSYLPSYATASIPAYYSARITPAAAAAAARPWYGAPAAVPAAPAAVYDIPLAATKNILDAFNLFRTALPKQSAPAAVRALTLSAKVNTDRSIQTSVCRDPYWTEPNLSKIYPWATLQFLCVKDYKKLIAEDSSIFQSEWAGEDGFIQRLAMLYGGGDVPKLTVPEGNRFLNRLTFGGVDTIPLCKESAIARVGFREVQDGLLRLQGLYEEHVKAVWDILNSLIIVIQDPDTKGEVVRLHPAVLRGPSHAYVAGKAAAARKLLVAHYLAVEAAYLDTVRKLRPV